jgi:hypothetical protein
MRTGHLPVAVFLFLLGPSALAGAPVTTTAPAPAAKPLSTSLGMVVFPAKGQTAQQQSQDEGECYAWSQGQAAEQEAAREQQLAPFRKGFGACLDSKGYTVK